MSNLPVIRKISLPNGNTYDLAGGDSAQDITWAEYQALTQEQKLAGDYYITDKNVTPDELGITDLVDTNISNPSNGHILYYSSGKWVNVSLSSALPTIPSSLYDLSDVSISYAPSRGTVLYYDGSNWIDQPLRVLNIIHGSYGIDEVYTTDLSGDTVDAVYLSSDSYEDIWGNNYYVDSYILPIDGTYTVKAKNFQLTKTVVANTPGTFEVEVFEDNYEVHIYAPEGFNLYNPNGQGGYEVFAKGLGMDTPLIYTFHTQGLYEVGCTNHDTLSEQFNLVSKEVSVSIGNGEPFVDLVFEFPTLNITIDDRFKSSSLQSIQYFGVYNNTTSVNIVQGVPTPNSNNFTVYLDDESDSYGSVLVYCNYIDSDHGDYIETFFDTHTISSATDVVNYDVKYAHVYGIRRDITSSSSAWERTDEAVGFSFSPSVGSTAGYSSFDNCLPWKEITRTTDELGNTLVKIPRFWFKRYVEDGYEYIKISDHEKTGFYMHPAFRIDKRLGFDSRYMYNYRNLYIGAYMCDSSYKSVTNVAPVASKTRSVCRTNINDNVNLVYQIDIYAWSAIQMLLLVEIANYNSQATIGQGYANSNSAVIKTGSCDSVANLTGRPTGTDGKVDVVWRGIEGLWGNSQQWVDGLNVYNSNYYANDGLVSTSTDDSTLTSGSVPYQTLSYAGVSTGGNNQYIMKLGVDDYSASRSCLMLPDGTNTSTSATTYVCDSVRSNTGWRVAKTGGYYADANNAGAFQYDLGNTSSNSYADTGCRLMRYIEDWS